MNVKYIVIGSFIFCLFFSFFSQAQTWEVYDGEYKLQSRLIYDEVDLLSETVRIGKKDSVLSLLSADLKPAVSLIGNEVYQYLEPWILVKGPNGIGAFHEYGQQVLPLEYDEIQTYFNLLLARKGTNYWIFERGSGKTTSLGKLDDAKLTKTGMLITKIGNEYFIPLSKSGQKSFQLLEDSDGDFLLTKEESGFGLINREGDYVMDPVVDELKHNKGNFYFGFDENQFLLIEGGDIKANVRYNSFHKITLENGVMLEYIHGKLRRVMEEDGILLDAVGIEEVILIDEDVYNVRFRDGNLGLLSKKGWLVKPNKPLDKILLGSDGLFPAIENGKKGFVNSDGEWMIDPQFEEVTLFSESLASFKQNGKWGVIRANGELIEDAVWDEVKPYSKGFSIVQSNNHYYLLNRNGETINQDFFDQILRASDGYFIVEKGEKSGILDPQGKELIPLEFETIQRTQSNLNIVRNQGKAGLISDSGEILLPVAFENILIDSGSGKILTKNLYEPVVVVEVETNGKKNKKGMK
ncbi:WG repeat-containing protein [Algoriphagus sp.]|uniref:WG repeat-containing protein n=1 Tax=Algoriphagus sp. TaxID=1872435 RepID=UPI0025D1D9E8|nr:WG repeat-containing protein [Algoriphagus sp.]